jgi:hypothetical protein
MKALGRYIYNCLNGNFEPHFIIQEDRKYADSATREQKVLISEQSLQDMFIRGRFVAEKINITVSKQLSSTTISLCLQDTPYPVSSNSNLPISGFPRTLMTEDLTQSTSKPLGTYFNSGPRSNNSVEPLPRVLDTRINGSFSRRTRAARRRRNNMRKSSSSDESPGNSPSLRKVKSQSNLRQDGNPSFAFQVSPEDVNHWARRRKSVDMISRGVYELDDTSSTSPPSLLSADMERAAHPVRKKSMFRLIL